MDFKNNLKELRREKNLSQETLAKLLNVSKMCVSHWERGNSEPGIAQLKRLAALFSVSIDYLVGYKDN